MAKKYILEPTELTFTEKKSPIAKNLVADIPSTSPLYGLFYNEAAALIPVGAIFDINNGDKFIAYIDGVGASWSRDGNAITGPAQEQVVFDYDDDTNKTKGFIVQSDVTTEAGTYTVSIYTETEDADPYPVKNFTYEHTEVAKNDIEDIIQAAYAKLKETESQEAYGHSPADRLVIAVAKLHNVDPEKALTTGNYPNQMKRIAAIIRGEFGKE